MGLREVLKAQIDLLDKTNQALADYCVDKPEMVVEIRQNIELIREIVQDIVTLELRPTIEDVQVLVDKINMQDENLAKVMEEIEHIGNTLKIYEEQDLIDSMLERIDDLEEKVWRSEYGENE